jgi:LmbE family N-acetylglucosaminyl deacetylase
MGPKIVAVSPHLDDLALSCGRFLAAHPGSLMVTAFAGGPPSIDPLPEWDCDAGMFTAGDDVVGWRREEDAHAATSLGATVRHLSHWDWQYRSPAYGYDGPTRHGELAAAVAADLARVIADVGAATVLVPLGIVHPDHQATAAGCLIVARRRPAVDWLVYDDLPYAEEYPTELARTVDALRDQGGALESTGAVETTEEGESVKRNALQCYPSQVVALGDRVEQTIAAAERIRRLVIPPD